MSDQTKLHAAIMNLPCKPPEPDPTAIDDGETYAYQCGHRDARHAAAELIAIAERSTAASAVLSDARQANPQAVTYPAEIWLQVGGDCDADECAPYSEIEHKREITWCWESIDRMDVKYVRADLAAAAPAREPVYEGQPSPLRGHARWIGPFPPRDLSKPAEQQGIFQKFHVSRMDGSDEPGGKHDGCRYFVLDLNHDEHAAAAMRAYAASCGNTHPELAADIEREFGPAAPAQPVQEPVLQYPTVRQLLTGAKSHPEWSHYGMSREKAAWCAIQVCREYFGPKLTNAAPSPVQEPPSQQPDEQIEGSPFPPLPFHVYTHPKIGKLYDRLALQMYAVKYAAAQAPVADSRDAARYRWLRDSIYAGTCLRAMYKDGQNHPSTVDALIDASMSASKEYGHE